MNPFQFAPASRRWNTHPGQRRGSMVVLMVLAALMFAAAPERPRDPWVFRCVLDEHPRMVVIALHEDLWLAYDATSCGLYKMWSGGVKFDGAVYTTVHGPQPTSVGQKYFEGPEDNPWRVVVAGVELTPQVRWRGYSMRDDQVTLRYELIMPDGHAIVVSETPEKALGTTQPSVFRVFHTSNVPPNAHVHLIAAQTSEEDASTVEIGSSFDARTDPIDDGFEHIAVLSSNGETFVTLTSLTPTDQ